jgi:organic radical activating enzyme
MEKLDKRYVVRKESSGAFVFDRRYCTYAIVNDETLSGLAEEYLSSPENDQPLRSTATYNDMCTKKFCRPISIGMQVTDSCNMGCQYCINSIGKCRKDFNGIEALQGAVEELSPLTVTISGGEPFLYPELQKVIRAVSTRACAIVDTNGTRFDEAVSVALEHKTYIRVSLDSHIEEVHDEVRGNYKDAVKLIAELSKQGACFSVNTVVHNRNIEHLDKFYDFLIDLGVRRWVLMKLAPNSQTKALEINSSDHIDVQAYCQDDMFTTYAKCDLNRSSIVISPDSRLYTYDTQEMNRVGLGALMTCASTNLWKKHGVIRRNHIQRFVAEAKG